MGWNYKDTKKTNHPTKRLQISLSNEKNDMANVSRFSQNLLKNSHMLVIKVFMPTLVEKLKTTNSSLLLHQ